MNYLIIIPILIVFFYSILKLKINSYKVALLFGILMPVFLISLFYIFKGTFKLSDLLFLLLIFETFSVFIILHIFNRVTFIFFILFSISLVSVTSICLEYEGSAMYLSFVVAFIFLMAENNQIFMRKSYEEAATEYQNKILDKQVEEVKNIYFTMRGWRHDYHNHLQKLKAHIALKQINEANDYLNQLEVDLDNVNQLVESGNINLDAILNSKISLALKNNIDINYSAKVPSSLSVSDIDLCVLIGNLIDNAVEACDKMPIESIKFIRIYIGVLKKQLYITVSNSTNEIIRKLDEEYITTKRGNHGHGLKRINNIIIKYEGYINRQNEPGVFVTEVLLPL